ncbi:MAG: Amidohydrolase [Acidimicrobiales bacterium]|jgi:predicted TIM-barrel fold metal-dependent hydrolase|nr:Amidohydrolase [Acidimicrobiales bacterium]
MKQVHPVFDSDAHVTEPPDLWVSRVSRRWGDRVPHVAWDAPSQREQWFTGDMCLGPVSGGASAGWRKPFPSTPPTFAEVHPAAHDPRARLTGMDRVGIAAAVLYPNVGGLGSERYRVLDDPDLAMECVRAYNDFLIDWCAADAARLIPVAAIPYWDVPAAVAEIERVASAGHRGLLFTGAPHDWGEPHLSDSHWDPVWAAAQAHRMVVSLHAGGGDLRDQVEPARVRREGMAVTHVRATTAVFLDSARHLADLLTSGVLARFPELRFVLVESGIGWIPFCLESLDHHFVHDGVARERPELDLLPSEYFRRQVYSTFWFEQIGPSRLLDLIGPDNVLFETDFPHPTSLVGDDVAVAIERALGNQPESVRAKVLFDNGAGLYGVERA